MPAVQIVERRGNTVKEYCRENGIDDLVWRRRNDMSKAAGADTVVEFPTRQR